MPIFRTGMPGAMLSLSADASVSSGGVVPFNVTDWSEQWPGIAGGVLTVPRVGTYLVTARWARPAIAAAVTLTMSVRLNGADVVTSERAAATTAAIRGSISGLIRCAAGGTIDLRPVTSNASSTTMTASATRLSVIRVGPERWTG